jgi:hypothetical protein
MPHEIAERKSSQWVYAAITLRDSERILYPTHVSHDRVIFAAPPKLKTTRVEIVIANGSDEFRSLADVLPHDQDATEIPIRSC